MGDGPRRTQESFVMPVQDRQYHHTFIWNRPGAITQAQLNRWSREVAQPPRSNAPPAPTMGPPSGSAPVNLPPRHKALHFHGSKVDEIWIEEKKDQEFEKHASNWELVWSRLVITWVDWRFLPVVEVVNQQAAVVGHCGFVKGNNLLVDLNGPPSTEKTLAEFFRHNRMYIGTQEFYRGMNLGVWGSEHARYAVLTDIYGEVTSLSFVNYDSNGTAISMGVTPLAWISIIRAGARFLLTQIGKLGVRTLARFRPTAPPPPPRLPLRALPPGSPALKMLPPGPPPLRALPPGPPVPPGPPQVFQDIMTPITDEVIKKLPAGRVANLIRNRAIGQPRGIGIVHPPANAEVPSINQAIELVKDARELWRAGNLSQSALEIIRDELYPMLYQMRPGIGSQIGRRFVPAR
jgi:hypothetical protein